MGKLIVALLLGIITLSDLASFSTFLTVQAQPAKDPRWTQFTQQQDGLISNNVRAVLSVDGAVWFGTDAGISVYTGQWMSFSQVQSEVGDGWLGRHAPRGQTTALAAGIRGGIWAGTDQGAVAYWQGEGWRLAITPPSPVRALLETNNGLWIGTDDGLYVWHEQTLTLVEAVGRQTVHALTANAEFLWVGTDHGLWRNQEGHWLQTASHDPWLVDGVFALQVDARGTLWAGTAYGVAWRHPNSSSWLHLATVDEVDLPVLVQSVTVDHSGAMWAGTDGAGVLSYVEADRASFSYGAGRDPNLSSRFVRAVAVDQDGSIWLATPAGVFRYQAYMWYSEVRGAGDFQDFVNDLLVDRNGHLWIATGGAGVRYKTGIGSSEQLFGEAEGVPAWVVTLAEDDVGGIWAGTAEGVVRYYGGRWSRPIPLADLPHPEITQLLYLEKSLWIGTNAGLMEYHIPSDRMEVLPRFAGRSIDDVTVDTLGALWVGAGHSIFVRSSRGSWFEHRYDPDDPNSLPGGLLTGGGLAADHFLPGGMWANLVDVGLVHWDGMRWSKDLMAEHVPGSLVWTVVSDPQDGSLWVGSEAGLTRYDGATWAMITAQDGLQTASIYAITPSTQHGYWIGGRNGLTHFRPDRTPPWLTVAPLGESSENDNVHDADNAGLHVLQGETLHLNVAAGDLQTVVNRVKVIYRTGRDEQWQPWQSTTSGVVSFEFDAPGEHRVQFQARDLSFNYSAPVEQVVHVALPVALVDFPLLGAVPATVFRALLVLGLLTLSGTVYITVQLAQRRRRGLEALRRKFNPYISGEPVRRDDMFFGRKALLQRVVDTLHHNSIMIHGERRIGKTTLLYQLASVLRDVDDPDYWFLPIYIDLEGSEQEDFFHYLMEEIAHGVEAFLSVDVAAVAGLRALAYREVGGPEYTDRIFNRDLRCVVGAMQFHGTQFEEGKQARLILLLDEMDVVSAYDQLIQQQLRRIFMRDFAATVGAVVAGIRISKAWDRVESPWFNLFNEIALEPFTREQARELLVEPVKGYYSYQPAAIDFILEHAEGRPFRIQQFGLEAVNRMLAANRRVITLADARAAHEVIRAVEMAQILSHNRKESR